MKRTICLLATASLLAGVALPARAAVNVQRSGSENPMLEVAKSVFYGGLAGLMVGSAIALVDDNGGGGAVKWGFVGGTFAGLGFGLYHVMSRPSGAALIEIENGKVHLAAIQPTLDPKSGVKLALVRAKF